MKRALILLALCSMLTACGGSPQITHTQPVTPPAPATPMKVVFIGDSMLGGNWSGDAGLQAAFPDYVTINKGIGGNSADQMLARFQADVLDQKPDVVVIWGSLNGYGVFLTEQQIEQDWVGMADAARSANVKVVVATLAPHGDPYAPAPDWPMNIWLRSEAPAHGIVVADFYTALVGPDGVLKPEYNQDGVHLTDAGHNALISVATASIRKAATGQ